MKRHLCVDVQIRRFVDPDQPGWVECSFLDADQREHLFVDKVPIFTELQLDGASAYPQPGVICCTVVDHHQRNDGVKLTTIDTNEPDGVESTSGETRFVVLATQLHPC